MNTLDLQAAAQFLGIHPHTLQARAKAGAIPGAKIGKEWRFLDADLAEYLRSQYPANQPKEIYPLRPIWAATHRARPLPSKDEEFESALNLPARKRRAG